MLDQDFRFAVRSLRRSPGFALVAVLVLTLGIGATSAVFSIVNGVLLRALPFADADRIVHLGGRMTRDSAETDWPLSPLDVEDARSLSRVFEAVAVVSNLRSFNLSADDEVEHVGGELVGAEFFRVYGLQPVVGRAFTDEEARAPGAAQVVVLSHDLWVRRFGADRGIVNRTVTLNDLPFTVLGVMPRGFHGTSDEAAVWAPIGLATRLYNQPAYLEMRLFRWAQGVALLRPGASLAAAQAATDAHARAMQAQFPSDNRGLRIQLTSLAEQVRGDLRGPLLALLAASALVLLIASTNVANLLLARGAGRERELAVRRALGAGTARIVRQLVTETMLLGAIGGAAGLALAVWLVRMLLRFGALDVAGFLAVGLDWRVVLATVVTSMAAAIAFGIAPALLAARSSPNDALRDGGRSTGGAGRRRFQNGLIGAEVALALMLLVGAGLTTRGFGRFLHQDLGYEPDGLLTMRIDYSAPRFATPEAVQAMLAGLLERARATPGVAGAAIEGPGYPTSGSYAINLDPDDRPAEPGQAPQARRHNVSPGYFATLGVPLLAGRDIGPQDLPGGTKVAVISRALARRLYPGQDPLGRHLVPNGNRANLLTVIGVVGDVRHQGPSLEADGFGDAYFAAAQFPPRNPSLAALIVRTAPGGDPRRLARPLAVALAEVAPGLAPYEVSTVREHLADGHADGRFLVFLMTAFAGVALVLAAVGIYGVIAHTVQQRTREIGIRMALGAAPGSVVGLVMQRTLRPVLGGMIAGTAGAAALSRLAASLLYGLDPGDPVTFGVMVAVLGGAAALAGLLPAWRATKIDPVVAFRAE